jgi:hypothetical protein
MSRDARHKTGLAILRGVLFVALAVGVLGLLPLIGGLAMTPPKKPFGSL